ncbi:MAG: biotin--[acetyl-CoA-carboxylase] ligase [Clostridium sp.]|nr:biotin--[acetyl-CoA-carboxylase] ligase [Clostridium sp.]
MKLVKLKTVDSTNNWALEYFEELEDLTVVYADSQTSGKGRFDRKWVSMDCENIYASFVLKPQNLAHIANFTQYMSLVVVNVLKSFGVSAKIKWPNDVLVENKKICGILCEACRKKNETKGVVLGVGINLNMQKNVLEELGRPAVSLNVVLNRHIDRDDFLNRLIQEFLKNYASVVENGFLYIKQDYLDNIEFLNKKVFIQQRDGAEKLEYTVLNITDDGSLVVCDIKGKVSTMYSGDLIL